MAKLESTCLSQRRDHITECLCFRGVSACAAWSCARGCSPARAAHTSQSTQHESPCSAPRLHATLRAHGAENRTRKGDKPALDVFKVGFWWGDLRCHAPKARRVTIVRSHNLCAQTRLQRRPVAAVRPMQKQRACAVVGRGYELP
eukprot:6197508-Pleurochrysis_carterae.AAC.3